MTLAYIDIVLQLNGSEYEWHNGLRAFVAVLCLKLCWFS